MQDQKTKILIVGAGKGGVAFLQMLKKDRAVDILGVVDINPEAPGIKLARHLDIPTSTNLKEFLNNDSLDEIIDVTGNDGVFQTLLKEKPEKASLIGGPSAKMIWLLLEERRRHEEEKEKALYDLSERIKELNCLYGLSEIVEAKDKDLESILQETVEIMPEGLRRPEIACARIIFEDKEYKTENFKTTPWVLHDDIYAFEKHIGHIEIYYLEERFEVDDHGMFLKEEENLLAAFTERLGRVVERQRATDEIKKAVHNWDNTFNAMSDLVLIQDKDFNITKVNKALADALKRKPEEIVGKKCYEVLHNKNEPWPQCPLEMTKSDFQSHTEEVDDPNIGIPLLVTSSPMFNDKGEFIGSIHVAKDISQAKESEKAVQAAKEELEMQTWGLKKTNEAIKVLYKELAEKTRRVQELDKLKTDFISTVSHELRTPLSITKEGISLVLDRIPGEINEKQERLLVTAKDNIDRLARIINSLLDISKIEAGKLELKRSLVNITDLIKLIVSSFEPKVNKKGLELKTTLLPKAKSEIYADADKIIQVLTNLVNNALKFTEEGFIEVSIEEKDNMLQCAVIDTGMGVSKDDLPKIFSKFQQFGRTEGGGDRGTGLGLSIARGLVEMHHGEIRVESELGKGSKFIFTLPKYTTENIIKESLSSLMSEAAEKNSEISLIIASVTDAGKVKEAISQNRLKTALEKMTESAQNCLRDSKDLAFTGSNEIIVLLPGCNKQNSLIIEGRLMQILDDYLNRHNLANIIKLRFGCATYPDEATTDEELIKKAKQS